MEILFGCCRCPCILHDEYSRRYGDDKFWLLFKFITRYSSAQFDAKLTSLPPILLSPAGRPKWSLHEAHVCPKQLSRLAEGRNRLCFRWANTEPKQPLLLLPAKVEAKYCWILLSYNQQEENCLDIIWRFKHLRGELQRTRHLLMHVKRVSTISTVIHDSQNTWRRNCS